MNVLNIMRTKMKKNKETPYWKYDKVRNYMQNYNKSYYLANREKIIREQTARNKKNVDQLRVYYRNYYEKNRDKLLKYAKEKRG